jgi:single-stranded-DNA-specific exonuclease
MPLTKRWLVAPPLSAQAEANLSAFSPFMRQVLHNRGFQTHQAAQDYLQALPPPGTQPSELLGMADALERIRWAIQKGEAIAVYGDYDADGVTATALLTQALGSLGADVRGYIPNRFDEGYGLNKEALATLFETGVRLVITVDCGVRSPEETDYARDLGLDLIITDHHHPGANLPHACAVINPKQPGDTYPDKNLAGVGLAYKLAVALLQDARAAASSPGLLPSDYDYLDLVALGTVADLAPLTGENRSLVRAGIEYLRKPHRQGLMSLIGASGLTPGRISASDIGYVLGPRLNAAGRLDSALAALKLLTTQDVAEAGLLAQKLDDQNRERQQITRQIQAQAEQIALADDPQALLLFAVHPDFNPGVVGLAASRLVDQFYRPAVVAHQGEETTRASCRSIPEFHITDALDQVADLLVRHGGHAAAAGFTVRNQNLPELIERLKTIAQQELGSRDLRPTLKADAEVPLSALHPDLLHELAQLQPTGQGNPEAVFISRRLRVTRFKTVGKESAHLKFTVTDGRIFFDAIAFRQGHWLAQMPPSIDLMYTFEVNEYNGQSYLQLNVRDLKPAGTPDE